MVRFFRRRSLAVSRGARQRRTGRGLRVALCGAVGTVGPCGRVSTPQYSQRATVPSTDTGWRGSQSTARYAYMHRHMSIDIYRWACRAYDYIYIYIYIYMSISISISIYLSIYIYTYTHIYIYIYIYIHTHPHPHTQTHTHTNTHAHTNGSDGARWRCRTETRQRRTGCGPRWGVDGMARQGTQRVLKEYFSGSQGVKKEHSWVFTGAEKLLRVLVAVFAGQLSAGLCPFGAWLVWYGCIYRVLTAHSRHTHGVLHGVLYGQRTGTSCALRWVTAYCIAAHQSTTGKSIQGTCWYSKVLTCWN
jgi:hypothetical protein